MAKTSTVTAQITVQGDGVGFIYTPPTMPVANPSSPGSIALEALTTGDNTIAVPPGASYMMVVPPVGSVVAKKLKGVGGDTGFSIHASNPTLVALASPTPATVLLNLSTGENLTLVFG